MNVHVFATDYDGTIAEDNRVAEATARALERVRATGRKLLLVTGRMLPDLQAVCPDVDRMFDAVVAENGALRLLPRAPRGAHARRSRPSRRCIDALAPPRRAASTSAARSSPPTRRTPRPRWPPSVRPASSARSSSTRARSCCCRAASPRARGWRRRWPPSSCRRTTWSASATPRTITPSWPMCECAVAVADAVPALRERADYVTRAAGRGRHRGVHRGAPAQRPAWTSCRGLARHRPAARRARRRHRR